MYRKRFIVLAFIFALFFGVHSEKAMAAGQECCTSGYYKPEDNTCRSKLDHSVLVGSGPFCNPNEVCVQRDFALDRGVCTEAGGSGEACCRGSLIYNIATNDCRPKIANNLVPPEPIQCGADEFCAKQTGLCVKGTETLTVAPKKLCEFAGDKRAECEACVNSDATGQSVWTAIGCVSVNPQGFIQTLLTFAIGIAGGIAFLMILYGAYSCMISAGNPEKLNGCKEIITSALMGLLLVVFSTVILQIIGVDILGGFPGFGQ